MNPSDTSPSDSDARVSVIEAPILHVDLDAFFASVEVLDDPSLRGRPIAVGGAGERGVIASASYEARRYGIYSAMPTVVARRRCPALVVLPGRFDRYGELSSAFHRIVNDLTPHFEPLGLDEVFADLRSLARLDVRPVVAAHQLRGRIRDELSIDCGVGLGRSKLFAKLASKRSKPRIVDGRLVPGPGVVYVDPVTEQRWLDELSVRSLWGVGAATAERLHRLGITTVRQLAEVDEATLRGHFGQAVAHSLFEMARGRDAREVVAQRANKSIGHEETFAVSLTELGALIGHVRRHGAVVARALRQSSQVAHTISVVVRFDDLTSVSRAQTLDFGLDDDAAIAEIAAALVSSIELRGPVRLCGVSASSLRDAASNQVQLSFDLASGDERAAERSRSLQAQRAALNDAVDDLRRRFGQSVVGQGADLVAGRVDVGRQRGSHAFGPNDPDGTNHRP